MLSSVIEGETYSHDKGGLYKVVGIAVHGRLLSRKVVVYQNLDKTSSLPAFTPHALGINQFMKTFNKVKYND